LHRAPRMRRHPASALALLTVLACSCAFLRARVAPVASSEEALLTRRIAGLQKLVSRGAAGSPLVDLRQAMVVVHQDVVRDLLLAAVPFEQTISDHYQVRVDSASAEFADGFALVRLAGRVELLGSAVSADVVVLGGLEVLGLERSGLLRCQVRIFAVEARNANVVGLDRPARELIDNFGREALDSLISVVDIPVKVEDQVTVPGVDAPRVRIPPTAVHVQARVVDVQVFGDRLWVGLAAAVGEPATGPASSGSPKAES
jgi:hypothetical protein